MTNDNKYHSMMESCKYDKLGIVEIKFEHVMSIDSLTMNFHHVSMDCSVDCTEVQMIDVIEIQSYLLILTELSNDKRTVNHERKELYYCIDSNWCEMNRKHYMIFLKSSFMFINTYMSN